MPSISISADASEFHEALTLVVRRRDASPPLTRMAIDQYLCAMGRGEIAREQLMVIWSDGAVDGHIAMHITPGPLLLELAMPTTELAGLPGWAP